MTFFAVAPLNTVSQKNAEAISGYLSPEFNQNWRLFAPEPPLANRHVQARTNIRMPDGSSLTTDWVDLSARDEARILHNPLPSRAHQTELSAAWFYFANSNGVGRRVGLYGNTPQQYLLRVVAHRIGPHVNGGTVRSIQVRMANMPLSAASWSGQQMDTTTSYQLAPWWTVKAEDFE
ncbi:DUF5819 family protein [Streptomyces sp. NPDC007264]|uniref:DUF5819 family protein n=1 Tax=Streptomyces sp. NPDC007264 TaxID=3364777 RepID=UPI0036DA391E